MRNESNYNELASGQSHGERIQCAHWAMEHGSFMEESTLKTTSSMMYEPSTLIRKNGKNVKLTTMNHAWNIPLVEYLEEKFCLIIFINNTIKMKKYIYLIYYFYYFADYGGRDVCIRREK